MINTDNYIIAIIGLGYVGLPLAVEFGKSCQVIGFDIDEIRISELNNGYDRTNETDKIEICSAKKLKFTNDINDLKNANIYIVTVPTPVDKSNRPDISILKNASKMVGSILKYGDIVIYESTVFPGCTEEICVPILENSSGLSYNSDFYCGYSPERINPGDKTHRLPNILKITSGSTPESARKIDSLYKKIIVAGTFCVGSIRVAEAAKVIENTQRDLNIALMNELSLIFHKMNIDTTEVLEAAGTKWNFLPFRPGLVGGHCIGVDPYYLTHKAQEIGHHPEIILAGRRINDQMSSFIAERTIKLMLQKNINILNSKVLLMGVTFKENCPDIRNTKVIDLFHTLKSYSVNVDIYDPVADAEELRHEYQVDCLHSEPELENYDAVIIAVGHSKFLEMGIEGIRSYGKSTMVLYDVKSLFPRCASDERL